MVVTILPLAAGFAFGAAFVVATVVLAMGLAVGTAAGFAMGTSFATGVGLGIGADLTAGVAFSVDLVVPATDGLGVGLGAVCAAAFDVATTEIMSSDAVKSERMRLSSTVVATSRPGGAKRLRSFDHIYNLSDHSLG